MRTRAVALPTLTLVTGLAACDASARPQPSAVAPAPLISSAPPTTTPSTAGSWDGWEIGAHPLPRRPDGFGEVESTPVALRNRVLPTRDSLPPPADGEYTSAISEVPADVLARSTWQAGCPVDRTRLRYLTMAFWGFDGRAHTGEMLVNASVAQDVTQVFGRLFAARFPIEEMRVTRADELDAAPTGDGNNTSAFVCRPVRGQPNWSAHAYGLAVDLDPFCNPYSRGDLVLPELASAYLDRSWRRPGMILPGDATVRAFSAIGWSWGGKWVSPTDRMHFSATGT
ncbi:M15 family metallopeptidase [Amycolatopsis sp.]|uniref:M15 family metallopeptidase n=1 Tax=Amycolatopsis sp. TaxID=37632 RepID=UPI0039C8AA6A